MLTPVRNEIWCLEGFLEATSAWADLIVVSDQMSTDGSRSLAERYPKVRLITNDSKTYNESDNRRNLILAARELAGSNNVLISLDADERLTPAILDPKVQALLRECPPGTAIRIPFANISPDLETYWNVEIDPVAWVDDGRDIRIDAKIHFPRTGILSFEHERKVEGLEIVHLQYVSINRFRIKQTWYILKEILELGRSNLVSVFRRYMHTIAVTPSTLKPVPADWRSQYESHGVDLFAYQDLPDSWREAEIREKFEVLNIATINKLPAAYFGTYQSLNPLHRITHDYLTYSQRIWMLGLRNPISWPVRAIDYLLSFVWRLDSASSLLWKRSVANEAKESTNS